MMHHDWLLSLYCLVTSRVESRVFQERRPCGWLSQWTCPAPHQQPVRAIVLATKSVCMQRATKHVEGKTTKCPPQGYLHSIVGRAAASIAIEAAMSQKTFMVDEFDGCGVEFRVEKVSNGDTLRSPDKEKIADF